MAEEIVRLEDVCKSYNVGQAVADGNSAPHRAYCSEGRVHGAHRRLGLWEKHAAQHYRPARSANIGALANQGRQHEHADRSGDYAVARSRYWVRVLGASLDIGLHRVGERHDADARGSGLSYARDVRPRRGPDRARGADRGRRQLRLEHVGGPGPASRASHAPWR